MEEVRERLQTVQRSWPAEISKTYLVSWPLCFCDPAEDGVRSASQEQ